MNEPSLKHALSELPWALQVPLQFRLGPLTTISIGIGLLARGGKGATYSKSTLPKEPIEIWGYEASPFVKLVREVGACPQLGRPAQIIYLLMSRGVSERNMHQLQSHISHQARMKDLTPLLQGRCCADSLSGMCEPVLCMQVLSELELPHLYHNVARNSPKRPLLTEKWGTFQVRTPGLHGS
jgi:hypothetical protein